MRVIFVFVFILSACQPSLERQPRVKPYSKLAMREAPEGTLAQEDKPTEPPELTFAELNSGRDLYEVHCAVCHGFSGKGDGMAVQRGFPKPESLTFKVTGIINTVQVIQNGKGKMYGMGERIPAVERYAIAYYVRALQLRTNPPKDLR